ncbi:MAG TPA: hypothetical protein VG733_03760 [Chthoniobacteraceae bacterium]|nr:hypothetical protein [Chthoniobacteraceae bacterium]
MTAAFEWQFGGWLHSLPQQVAWMALGAVAVGGLALIVFSYGSTLQKLSAPRRWVFTTFRLLALAAVLLCLANPVRVERPDKKEKPKRALAVLVDRSGSMAAKDNRSQTRLDNAVRLWNQHATELKQGFDRVDYYRFSSKLTHAADMDDALKATDPGSETRLYEALNQLLDSSPAGIACLTDGLDTTGAQAGMLVAKAQRLSVPIYFVAGSNRTRPPEYMCIREVKIPSQVLRHTQFTASVAVEVASNSGGELPIELWNKDKMVASTKLTVRPGVNVLPWSVPITSKEPEAMQLEFRAGEAEHRDIATATTQVVDKTNVNVLYYQGALLWGYRYLLTALQNDPSFRMSAILNPGLNMQLTSSTPDGQSMRDLPESADALKPFQIVVLANVFADQLSAKQQMALVNYVKGGGAVLFITPDSDASGKFAGTPLEQMLPVVFTPPPAASKEGDAEKNFQQRMNDAGGADAGMETSFADQMIGEQTAGDTLLPFTAPPGGDARVSRLFQPGPNAPKFASYAKVNNVKPGAEVLAVHPTDRMPGSGAPRVLIARQTFGAGSSAVMTTDLLWRWKMSLSSESHVAETFWQQFMLMLARTTSGRGLLLVKNSVTAQAGRPVSVQVDAAPGSAPKLEAVSPSGAKIPLSLEPQPGVTDGQQVLFTPYTEGQWEVTATDAAGNFARVAMPVGAKKTTVESLDDPADIEGLRRIAEGTGGSLIENQSGALRPRTDTYEPPEVKRMQPLWDSQWLIIALLAIYATELVARRMAKLL